MVGEGYILHQRVGGAIFWFWETCSVYGWFVDYKIGRSRAVIRAAIVVALWLGEMSKKESRGLGFVQIKEIDDMSLVGIEKVVSFLSFFFI
ncbi:hypothetical protein NC651_008223 [Populus alba x Populus x berolinensis]|nr:hypothetical protein NC651_008223 [Populus alba x Populus x berolinensis]